MNLEKKLSILKILIRIIQLYILVNFIMNAVNKGFVPIDISATIVLLIGYNISRSNVEFKTLFGPVIGMIFSIVGIGYSLFVSNFIGIIIFSFMCAMMLNYAISINSKKYNIIATLLSIIVFIGLVLGVPSLPVGNLVDSKLTVNFNIFGKSDKNINKSFSQIELGNTFNQVKDILRVTPKYDNQDMQNLENFVFTTILVRYDLNSGENIYANIKYEANENFSKSRDKNDLKVISKELVIGDNRNFFTNYSIDFSNFSKIEEELYIIDGLSTGDIKIKNVKPVSYNSLVENLKDKGMLTYVDDSKKIYYFIDRTGNYIKVTTNGSSDLVSNIVGNINKKEIKLNQNIYKF